MSNSPFNRASSQNKQSLSAIDWLSQGRQSADVLATARRLIELEQLARKGLPRNLAAVCRVARFEGQDLTLAVPSAAHAAKIRQLAPRIVQLLISNGWNLNQIKVKVQASLNQNVTKESYKKEANTLDEQALTSFENLYHNTPPGPLADSLKRLLERHRMQPD